MDMSILGSLINFVELELFVGSQSSGEGASWLFKIYWQQTQLFDTPSALKPNEHPLMSNLIFDSHWEKVKIYNIFGHYIYDQIGQMDISLKPNDDLWFGSLMVKERCLPSLLMLLFFIILEGMLVVEIAGFDFKSFQLFLCLKSLSGSLG